MPEFSIIIPAHNEEKYITKTLESVKRQDFQDYEIIIVTNGCTDKTEEVVKKHLNDKIRHLSLQNANVSVARNAGALNAKGKLLLFLDADTTLEPNALQTIHDHFAPQHSVASTRSKADMPGWKFSLMLALKNAVMRSGLYETCSGALICKREHFHKVGGYNPEKNTLEHRALLKSLLQEGEYTCINTTVSTSMRRHQQWSMAKSASFWTRQWMRSKLGRKAQEYETIR